MAHRLKALFIAMAAVTAVSAVAASAAYAVPEFHSHETKTTLTVRQDGTGKTAHQVFDAGGGLITCETISADATTEAKTVTEITVTEIKYGGCTFFGSPATVNMNGCHYLFTSHGGSETAGTKNGLVHVLCPAGKEIEFGILNCTVKVPPQTPTGGGTVPAGGNIMYHNIGSTPLNTTEVTVEPNVTGIHYHATGTACTKTGSTLTDGEYTTGNVIVTGEKDDGSKIDVPIWWE